MTENDEVDPVHGVDGCMSGRTTSDPAELGPVCCGQVSIGRAKDGTTRFTHEVDPTCVHRCCKGRPTF
jgi:hypothetical protein